MEKKRQNLKFTQNIYKIAKCDNNSFFVTTDEDTIFKIDSETLSRQKIPNYNESFINSIKVKNDKLISSLNSGKVLVSPKADPSSKIEFSCKIKR